MKINFIFLFCSFCFFANSNAQILDINKPLFTDDPFFNTEFIKENKIKSIIGSKSSKKIKDIIRSKGLDLYYEFNNKGLLLKQITTFLIGGINKDTNIISYQYNSYGNLILRRKSDNYGFYSYQYQLDSQNRIIKQTYSRDENSYDYIGKFKLRKQYKISNDSFSFQQLGEHQIKKFYYNNYGKIYKQQINYYNDFNYLIEQYSKFLIGNNKSKIIYEYDEKGRLVKRINFSNLTSDKKITQIYKYDELGNILSIKIFDNDIHITTKQFIYDKKTMLLTAQLIQDIKSEFVQIIQYEYSFFENEISIRNVEESSN